MLRGDRFLQIPIFIGSTCAWRGAFFPIYAQQCILFAKHALHSSRKDIYRERLGYDLHALLQHAFIDKGSFGIAGNKQHLEVGPCPPSRIRKLPSVHAGQTNVSN